MNIRAVNYKRKIVKSEVIAWSCCFRLASTMDEAFAGLCEATTTEMRAICFSSSREEDFCCTGYSIHGTVSMEKRQVPWPLLQLYSRKFIEI